MSEVPLKNSLIWSSRECWGRHLARNGAKSPTAQKAHEIAWIFAENFPSSHSVQRLYGVPSDGVYLV